MNSCEIDLLANPRDGFREIVTALGGNRD